MKISIELDESIYQAIKRLMPGLDPEIVLAGLLTGMVMIIATHQQEFVRGYQEGSKEDKERIDEQVRKLFPKIIEKARLD